MFQRQADKADGNFDSVRGDRWYVYGLHLLLSASCSSRIRPMFQEEQVLARTRRRMIGPSVHALLLTIAARYRRPADVYCSPRDKRLIVALFADPAL